MERFFHNGFVFPMLEGEAAEGGERGLQREGGGRGRLRTHRKLVKCGKNGPSREKNRQSGIAKHSLW